MILDAATIKQFPKLEPDEEREMWQQYRDPTTKPARKESIKHRMITSHLRMARSAAYVSSKSRNLPFEDLFGSAQVGLLIAFDRYDIEKGVRFSTYAKWWIRQEIQSYILENQSPIANGNRSTQKYLFFNYGRLEAETRQKNPNANRSEIDLLIAQTCVDDEVPAFKNQQSGAVRSVEKVLEEILTYKLSRSHVGSLDVPVSHEDGSSPLVDFIIDENDRPVEGELIEREARTIQADFLKAVKKKMLEMGKERSWDILQARGLMDPILTLEELSQRYNVSRERIRQIEVKAFELLKEMAANSGLLNLESDDNQSRRNAVLDEISIVDLANKSKVRMMGSKNKLEDEYDCPEVDPDPNLLHVPYIGIGAGTRLFVKTLKDFNQGNRHNFKRASIVKNGREYLEGRLVYVGPSLG